jgi:nucleoside-diphosphate-sugar epimerase
VFAQARDTGAAAADVISRPESAPAPLLAIAAPVVRDGRFDGVVLGAVESTRLSDLLSAPRAGAGSETYLVDAAGRAIAHPDVSLAASLIGYTPKTSVEEGLRRTVDAFRADFQLQTSES